jgi:hypothetical protein
MKQGKRHIVTLAWPEESGQCFDEALYTDAPEHYGEMFVMRYDGTEVEQLTGDGKKQARMAGRVCECSV